MVPDDFLQFVLNSWRCQFHPPRPILLRAARVKAKQFVGCFLHRYVISFYITSWPWVQWHRKRFVYLGLKLAKYDKRYDNQYGFTPYKIMHWDSEFCLSHWSVDTQHKHHLFKEAWSYYRAPYSQQSTITHSVEELLQWNGQGAKANQRILNNIDAHFYSNNYQELVHFQSMCHTIWAIQLYHELSMASST